MCDLRVVTMFIHKTTKRVGNKIHHSHLLSESYRENGKVKHRIISNLSRCPQHLIDAVSSALKGQPATSLHDLPRKSGKNFGGLFVLKELAKDRFIEKILGTSRKGKLAMLLVLGRILTQGSRRHLTFWKEGQAIEEVLGLKSFDEDDLYKTLDWLAENQAKMEDQWFKLRFEKEKVELFLYDVTSSYLEGDCNELADYGYNRDGKRGKKQIVIGLLTQKDGQPVAVEVFRGNTSDVTTVPSQIRKMAERFGVSEVTFVGDRGMVKKIPIESLKEHGWHYITAITKPQIESLIARNVFQLGLFEEKLVEIAHEGIRYLLRRNPQRVEEIGENRKEKMQKVRDLCKKLCEKLETKPKSSPESALRELQKKISQLKLKEILTTTVEGRSLLLSTNEEALQKASRLDGCYVIKTDLSREKLKAEEVHSTYKDLSEVEWAFRTMKTGLLEIRPLYHRKANRTRACAFVAMLAYAITQSLWKKTAHLNRPLEPILSSLDQIQIQEIKIAGQWVPLLPTHLREDQESILKALKISLPKTLRRAA
jgi:transposase